MKNLIKTVAFCLPLFWQGLSSELSEPELALIFDSKWGNVDKENYPWIHTSGLGWIYIEGESSSNYWFWISGLGWLNSSKEYFPICQLHNTNGSGESGSVLLDNTELSTIKYWHFESREWKFSFRAGSIIHEGSEEYFYYIDNGIPVPPELKSIFSKYYSYGNVPESLAGIKAKNPIPEDAPRLYDSPAVSIGPYYLLYIDNTGYPENYIFDVYYYNSYDNWFYGAENRTSQGTIIPGTMYGGIQVSIDEDKLVLETKNGESFTLKIVQYLW